MESEKNNQSDDNKEPYDDRSEGRREERADRYVRTPRRTRFLQDGSGAEWLMGRREGRGHLKNERKKKMF